MPCTCTPCVLCLCSTLCISLPDIRVGVVTLKMERTQRGDDLTIAQHAQRATPCMVHSFRVVQTPLVARAGSGYHAPCAKLHTPATSANTRSKLLDTLGSRADSRASALSAAQWYFRDIGMSAVGRAQPHNSLTRCGAPYWAGARAAAGGRRFVWRPCPSSRPIRGPVASRSELWGRPRATDEPTRGGTENATHCCAALSPFEFSHTISDAQNFASRVHLYPTSGSTSLASLSQSR